MSSTLGILGAEKLAAGGVSFLVHNFHEYIYPTHYNQISLNKVHRLFDLGIHFIGDTQFFKRLLHYWYLFSLILMDIRMPRLDGFSTAEAIRDREGNRLPTPIIALSVRITSEDEERCESMGINDYLQKPLKIKVLNEFLKKWLSV